MRFTKIGGLLSTTILAALLAVGPAAAQRAAGPAGSAAPHVSAAPHANAAPRVGAVAPRGNAAFNATPRGTVGPRATMNTMRGPRTAQFTDNRWRDHNWNRGDWRNARRFHRGPGFGLALGYSYWDDNPYVYGDDYAYDDGTDADAYAAAPEYYAETPAPGGDAAYCMQRFKSYDSASGTYLGYDGERHPCP